MGSVDFYNKGRKLGKFWFNLACLTLNDERECLDDYLRIGPDDIIEIDDPTSGKRLQIKLKQLFQQKGFRFANGSWRRVSVVYFSEDMFFRDAYKGMPYY